MEPREAIEMMKRCGEEIQSLKQRIEYLAPRAEAYEVLRNVVMMQHRGGEGMPMGHEVIHLLNNAIKREEDRAKQAEPDRSKEYRGGVVSAEQPLDAKEGTRMQGTVSGVEQYRAAKAAEAKEINKQMDIAAEIKAKVEADVAAGKERLGNRPLGKRPGYDGVKD